MFGEKYAEEVRVVSVPGVSMELCGGTHVDSTSQIGGFKVLSEGGISSGVRRIEVRLAEPVHRDKHAFFCGLCDLHRSLGLALIAEYLDKPGIP